MKLLSVRNTIPIVCSLAFVLSVTIAPLYTNNQNSYFFHGLARSNYGHLREDFLFSTSDPFPLFSLIIQFTNTFSAEFLIYIFHAILLVIYFVSLTRFSNNINGFKTNRTYELFISLTLILTHSASSGYISTKLFNSNIPKILYEGVAGQTLINPEFQPSTFGILCISSIFLYTKNRTLLSLFLLSISSWIHPSYIPISLLILMAYVIHIYSIKKCRINSLKIVLLGALLIGMPAVWHFWRLGSENIDTMKLAAEILVVHRIPHHAQIASWLGPSVILKIVICITAIIITRKNTLGFLLSFLLLSGIGLTCIQYITDNHRLALLFPWRISVVIVPISFAVIIGYLIPVLIQRLCTNFPKPVKYYPYLLFCMVISCAIVGLLYMFVRVEKTNDLPFHNALEFSKDYSRSGNLYMIPPNLMDFRLHTGNPVFVDDKTHPFRPKEIVQWYERKITADNFYSATEKDCDFKRSVISENHITHTLVQSYSQLIECDMGSIIYADNDFTVIRHDEKMLH